MKPCNKVEVMMGNIAKVDRYITDSEKLLNFINDKLSLRILHAKREQKEREQAKR